LTDRGVEPRKTNGKKVYDVNLIDLPEDNKVWDESPF
jgi:hypothetical protein